MAGPQFRFTTFDLNSCLEMADALHAGGGLMTAAELASRCGYKSDNNGSFNTRLANAKLFGLIDGPSSALKITARSLAILRPDYPVTAEKARLEAFEAVPLFKEVLREYNGQPLPDPAGLANALTTRWHINADKAAMVTARLLDSADQAGLFKVAGNRSKMIRPTFSVAGGPGATRPAEEPASVDRARAGGGSPGAGARSNKIIDGVLDELPADRSWDEQSLIQWLGFFEDALRLYYRLPRQEGVGACIGRGRDDASQMATS